MDIQTQLTALLENQKQIMENQIVLLAESIANYGPASRQSVAVKGHIEHGMTVVRQTEVRIHATRDIVLKE